MMWLSYGKKCRNQVSDQELGAKQNVTKHVIGPPTVWIIIYCSIAIGFRQV